MNSIWSSTEVDAWSRDFSYNDYLDYHHKTYTVGEPLSLRSYTILCGMLNAEMETRSFDGEGDFDLIWVDELSEDNNELAN